MSQSQSTSVDHPEATELNARASRRSPLLIGRRPLTVRQDVAGHGCCPVSVEREDYQAMVSQMLTGHEKMDRMESEMERHRAEDMIKRAQSRHEFDALCEALEHRKGQLQKLRMLIGKNKNERNKLLVKELLMAQGLLRQLHMKSKRYEDLKMTVTCTICMDARCSTAFQCGHLSCGDCSDRLLHCHICRLPIAQRMRIFL